MNKIPRLDKKIFSVTLLTDIEEEKNYWLSKTPAERLVALEINRRMVYGEAETSSRLQRVLEIADLK